MSILTTKLLKRVASLSTGTTPSTKSASYYDSEDVDWYTPGDINTDSIYPNTPAKKISNLYFEENSIPLYKAGSVAIVGIGATVGKIAYIDHDFFTNQQLNVLRFNKDINPKYAAYFLFNKKEEIISTTPSVTLPILNQTKLGQLTFIYPPLSEQDRIVSYLDSKTSAIDHAISLLERKREAYTRLKASVINRAVTRGLNPNVKLKDSGVEWIGKIPVGWKVKRLKNITLLNPICKTHMHGVVSFVPMESLRNDNIDLQTIKFEEGINKYTFFSNDDLLIAKVTPCFENGNIAIAQNLQQGIGFGSSEIYVLRAIKGEVCNRYLFYLCESSSFRDEACATMHGVGGLKRISPLFMQTCEIALPPLPEQRSIASYLDAECSKIDRAASIVAKEIDAYKRLKRSLINEVVTGKRKVE